MVQHPKRLIACIVVGIVLLVLILTCPSADKHRDAIAGEVNKAVSSVVTESYGILGAVGSIFVSPIVNVAVGELLDVDNYLLFSIGKMTYAGETNVVSVGVLNHIFTIHSDKIEKQLNEVMDELPFE